MNEEIQAKNQRKQIRENAMEAGAMIRLAKDVREQAGESGVPQELRNALTDAANRLCVVAAKLLQGIEA